MVLGEERITIMWKGDAYAQLVLNGGGWILKNRLVWRKEGGGVKVGTNAERFCSDDF